MSRSHDPGLGGSQGTWRNVGLAILGGWMLLGALSRFFLGIDPTDSGYWRAKPRSPEPAWLAEPAPEPRPAWTPEQQRTGERTRRAVEEIGRRYREAQAPK